MGRLQKTELPENHPLWKAVRQEESVRQPGVSDIRAAKAVHLADEVTDLLETGGELELRGADGKMHKVHIKGL